MRKLLLVILISFLTFIIGSTQAQDETPPIIALSAGGIYAVTVAGNAELLVPPPDNYQAIREIRYYDTVTLFSAEWLSPDGQYLAYRVRQPIDPLAPINENTSYTDRLFLLDLYNLDNTPLALELKSAANYWVKSLAWSLDGEFLYLVIQTFSAASNTSAWSLEILERDNWMRQLHIALSDPDGMARQIFATEKGVVIWDNDVQALVYAFTLFDSSGQQINQFQIDWNVSPDVNLYINTPFTPLEVDDTVRFGLVNWLSGELIFQIDFATGEVSAFESSHLPGMVSRSAPDSSIRLSPVFYDGDAMGFYIRDAENNYIGDIEYVRSFAFGILGVKAGTPFSLSPDGQTLAYLHDGELMLWHDGEVQALDFTAEVVAWSPPMYVPIHDPAYFRG